MIRENNATGPIVNINAVTTPTIATGAPEQNFVSRIILFQMLFQHLN